MAVAWNKYSYGQQKANKYFYAKKTAHEKENKYARRFCRICGKPATSGGLCQSCDNFIKQKQQEERTGNK